MEEKELKEMSTHIFYEIEMLNISAIKIHNLIRRKISALEEQNKEKTWQIQINLNVFIESFAIHSRNLIEFLQNDVCKNYVRAKHYLNDKNIITFREFMKQKSSLVKYIQDKTNNQVAHLTFDRINDRFKEKGKSWDLKKIHDFNEILKEFLSLAEEKFLCENLIKLKQEKNIFHYYAQKYIER